MNDRIVSGSIVLLACFLASVPLAGGPGPGHAVKSLPGAKMHGVETRQPVGDRDLLKGDGDHFPDGRGLGLAGAGRAFRHTMGSVAGLVRRPVGWDRGNKTGWGGGSVPPGLAKKERLPSKFVHRALFARRGEGGFAGQDITRRQVANFDRFLDLHPGLDRSLMQNPTLVNNQAFLATHPSLAAWLRAHPRTAEELRENPQAFMKRERRFDAFEARFPRGDEDINRQEVANFDRFLDSNPGIAGSLSKNPSLINNSAFLAKNPSLATWLKAHPEAAEELRENPQAFMKRERRFDAFEARFPRGDEDIDREATRPEEREGSDDL